MVNHESETKHENKATSRERIAWISLVLAILSLAASIYLTYTDRAIMSDGQEAIANAGARGDFWGGHIGAGASLAGTFFFFSALMLQQEELRAQRQELKAAREIASRQEKTLRRQNEIAEKNATVSRLFTLRDERDRFYADLRECAKIRRDGTEVRDVNARRYRSAYPRFAAVEWIMQDLLDRPFFDKDERSHLIILLGMSRPLPRHPDDVTLV